MGTTCQSIHIYTPEKLGEDFKSFSLGWQTYLNCREFDNYRKVAKRMSKTYSFPVLYFEIYDSEAIGFEIYQSNRLICRFDSYYGIKKNIFKVSNLIGYKEGNKQRLSKILTCQDIDYMAEMLDEYFGVCLRFYPDDPIDCECKRDNKFYLEYYESEKQITGKLAPIKLQLVEEIRGKLFINKFGDIRQLIKSHYFFGYNTDSHNLQLVIFEDGKLKPSNEELYNNVCSKPELIYSYSESLPNAVIMSEKCPKEYAGKTIVLPHGYFPDSFDEKNNLLLIADTSVAFVDSTLKIIAKSSVKGIIIEHKDGYILTVGADSFCGYEYNPNSKVRIYKIVY